MKHLKCTTLLPGWIFGLHPCISICLEERERKEKLPVQDHIICGTWFVHISVVSVRSVRVITSGWWYPPQLTTNGRLVDSAAPPPSSPWNLNNAAWSPVTLALRRDRKFTLHRWQDLPIHSSMNCRRILILVTYKWETSLQKVGCVQSTWASREHQHSFTRDRPTLDTTMIVHTRRNNLVYIAQIPSSSSG